MKITDKIFYTGVNDYDIDLLDKAKGPQPFFTAAGLLHNHLCIHLFVGEFHRASVALRNPNLHAHRFDSHSTHLLAKILVPP